MEWMRRAVAPIVTLLLLAAPAAADAARRYADPNGSTTSPQCAQADPCRIDRAVNAAADGDEVVIAPGTYKITTPLKPHGAVDIHGDVDYSAPRLVAAATLNESVIAAPAGTLRHLSIDAAATGKLALVLRGGVADGLIVNAAADAATIVASSTRTVLRNSVIQTSGSSGGTSALELADHDDGDEIDVRNVTVMATGGSATGIECDLQKGRASLVNTLVRGGGYDIKAAGGCTAAFSNFRPAFSSGLAPGTGNQSAEPLFADSDYRPAAGSPTIDAGAAVDLMGSADIDADPRTLDAAPDIGADEVPPPPGPPAGPGPDTDTPGVTLGGRRVQRLRRRSFHIFATSDENGEFRGSARVRVPSTGASAVVRARRVTIGAVAGQRTKLVFRLSRRAARRVRRGLRAHRRLTALVTVVTADAAGNTTVARRRLKLRR
jgi:hypothetical protein